jgi:hypothetical protein
MACARCGGKLDENRGQREGTHLEKWCMRCEQTKRPKSSDERHAIDPKSVHLDTDSFGDRVSWPICFTCAKCGRGGHAYVGSEEIYEHFLAPGAPAKEEPLWDPDYETAWAGPVKH